MAVIKVWDIAYARMRSPDLDKQEEFLNDFGLVKLSIAVTCVPAW